MSVIVKTHTLTQVSQDIANNTSQVRYLVQLQTTGGSFNNNNITTTYYIDGIRYTKTHKLPKTSTTTVVDRTVTISHNEDGTRSVSASFSTPTQISAGTITGSKSLTLSTIPRADDFIANDTNIGSMQVIGITNRHNDDAYKYTYQYKLAGQNDWTTLATKTNDYYLWTVPTTFYNYLSSTDAYIDGEIKVITYINDSDVGYKTRSVKYIANHPPIINSYSVLDTNSTTIALTDDSSKIVLNASNVQVTANATAQYGATISSIVANSTNMTLSGTNPKTGTLTINKCTINSFVIKVIDSRGLSTTQSYTAQTINYIPLTINATIKRNQPTDEKVNINFSGNYFNDSFGSQSNTLTIQYRYKESTSSTWGNWVNLTSTISNNTYSGTEQINNIDYQKIYNFEIRATDKVGTKTIQGITVSKGEPVYWWDDDGFYVNGKFKTRDAELVFTKLNSKNLFNQNILIGIKEWEYSSGYFTGPVYAIRNFFNDNPMYTNYKSNTPYTISLEGYMGTATNVRVRIFYTDDTYEDKYLPTNASERISMTSNSNKTISSINFTWTNSGTIYLKDIQLEEGALTNYTQYQGTGCISGDNTTGDFVIFDNGGLITSQRYEWTGAIDTAWGSLYQSAQISLPNFPVMFSQTPTITYSVDGTGKTWLFNNGSTANRTKAGSVNLVRPTTLSSGTFYVNVIAMGKWK